MLLAVVRLRDGAYGRAILKEVETRLERDIAAGAVHATLTRLEHKGYLSSHDEPGTPARAGRPRRYYELQALGRRALNDSRATVDTLWHGLRWPLKGRT